MVDRKGVEVNKPILEQPNMLPLKQVLRETGLSYTGLKYYTSQGLIPEMIRLKDGKSKGYKLKTVEKIKKIRRYLKPRTIMDILKNPEVINERD